MNELEQEALEAELIFVMERAIQEDCWNCGHPKENPNGLCPKCCRFPIVPLNEEEIKALDKLQLV